MTALRTLRLGPAILGRRILVTGASGGVGRFAVQLGGAEVTALVANPNRAAGVRVLGAHDVATDVSQLEGRFDLVLESVGGDTLAGLLTKLDPDGTLVMFGNSSGQTTAFNVRDIYLDACVRLQGFELFRLLCFAKTSSDSLVTSRPVLPRLRGGCGDRTTGVF